MFSEEIFSIQDAFKECANLKRIMVPVNVAKFSVDLSGCTSLRELYLPQQIDELCLPDEHGNVIAEEILISCMAILERVAWKETNSRRD